MRVLWTTELQQNGSNQAVKIRPSSGEQHAEFSEQINIRGDMVNNLCDGNQMEQEVGKIQRKLFFLRSMYGRMFRYGKGIGVSER